MSLISGMLTDIYVKFVQQVNSIVLSLKNVLVAQKDLTLIRRVKSALRCVRMDKSTTQKLKSVNVLRVYPIMMVPNVWTVQDHHSGVKMPWHVSNVLMINIMMQIWKGVWNALLTLSIMKIQENAYLLNQLVQMEKSIILIKNNVNVHHKHHSSLDLHVLAVLYPTTGILPVEVV